MTTAVLAAAVLVGVPGLAAALHLGMLAAASLGYRERPHQGDAATSLLVLIPAHDEELVIGDCLAAIAADRRPQDHVLVVADRCTDATAAIARAAGAEVLERGADDLPGRAAARQAGLDHARSLPWDAVVMLDADSIIRPGFFTACAAALGPGVAAVQARSESAPGHSIPAEVAAAAFTLQGITIPRGRSRLGLSVRLRGTGMAIRRETALAHRFTAPASEDLYFTLDLLLKGVHCVHLEDARVHSQGANSWSTFGGQKVRYEAGRMAAARDYVPRLLRRGLAARDASCLETAWFLAVPPFASAALSVILAAGLAALAGSTALAAVFAGALAVLALSLAIGLVQARAGVRTWLSLVAAPWYLVWKGVIQLRALVRVLRRGTSFGATARA